MYIILNILFFLILPFGFISGLSLAVTINCFFILTLFIMYREAILGLHLHSCSNPARSFLYGKRPIIDNKFLCKIFSNYKLELAFAIWLLLSCLWSSMPKYSMLLCLKMIITLMIGLIINANIGRSNIITANFEKLFFLSFFISILLFYIELFTQGNITKYFRHVFQSGKEAGFLLHYLNRGCSFLAMVSWIAIGLLLKTKRYFPLLGVYLLVLITLGLSDSLASFIAFLIGGLVFILSSYYKRLNNPKIISVILIGMSLSFIIFANVMNPLKISTEYSFLPLSAKHRLFIWDYVAKKANDKLLYGQGYEASRYWQVEQEAEIIYQDINLSPLPLHPHNNLLQILFETGLIGLILYLSIACKYIFTIASSGSFVAIKYSCYATYFIISMLSYNIWQSWWVCIPLWISCIFSSNLFKED